MIKTHRELASFIAGKKILHMNSYGKDSILCLDWLTSFAHPREVYSLNFKFLAPHPKDAAYKRYLKGKFPTVKFLEEPNPFDISRVLSGVFQNPVQRITELNKTEHFEFDHKIMAEDIRLELGCDYLCYGLSRYESFSRAKYFHKKGLVDGPKIHPLGMMSKKEVLSMVQGRNLKVHPSYKTNPTTIDSPSYYKMRSSFILYPEYEKEVYKFFPLLELDKYRYEVLLK